MCSDALLVRRGDSDETHETKRTVRARAFAMVLSSVVSAASLDRPPVADSRGPFLFTTSDSLQWRERISKEDATSERLQKLIRTDQQLRTQPRRKVELTMPKPCYTFSLVSARLSSQHAREDAARTHLKRMGSWPRGMDKNQFGLMDFAAPAASPTRMTPWRS